MIKFRPYKDEDLLKIDQICSDGSFPVRHLLVTERVATRNDEIVGYGNVRLIPEATMILDHEGLSKKEKVFVLKELLKVAHRDTKLLDTFMHLYGFCANEDFAIIMENHFGYQISDRKIITLSLKD